MQSKAFSSKNKPEETNCLYAFSSMSKAEIGIRYLSFFHEITQAWQY